MYNMPTMQRNTYRKGDAQTAAYSNPYIGYPMVNPGMVAYGNQSWMYTQQLQQQQQQPVQPFPIQPANEQQPPHTKLPHPNSHLQPQPAPHHMHHHHHHHHQLADQFTDELQDLDHESVLANSLAAISMDSRNGRW